MKALALVFLLFAISAIRIDTTKLADGGTETRTEGSRRVTVERSGVKTIVTVYEAARVDTIVMERRGNRIRVTRGDNGKPRPLIAVDRPAVIVDGIDLEPFLTGAIGEPVEIVQPPQRRAPMVAGPSFYVCPKDAAMLRVLDSPRNATYHCPVDGTEMKESIGRGRQYWLLD